MSNHKNRSNIEGRYNYAPTLKEDTILDGIEIGCEVTKTVRIVNELYHNGETGFSVYDVEEEGEHRYTISGTFIQSLSLDSFLKVTGQVKLYNGCRQIAVTSYRTAIPQNSNDTLHILHTLHGLNRPVDLLAAYGDTVIADLINAPHKVAEKVSWLTLSQCRQWQDDLCARNALEEIVAQLQKYGLSLYHARILYDRYGSESLNKIRSNPYFLIDEIDGIKFLRCDKVALASGYPIDGTDRIMQAMIHVLWTAAYAKGHCFLTAEDFINHLRSMIDITISNSEATKLLQTAGVRSVVPYSRHGVTYDVTTDQLRAALQSKKHSKTGIPLIQISTKHIDSALKILLGSNRIIKEFINDIPCLMLGSLYEAETSLVNTVKRLQQSENHLFLDTDTLLDAYCHEQGVTMETNQKEAVIRFSSSIGGIHILDGPAGSGKTFTLKAILSVLRKQHEKHNMAFKTMILAPTGKAAKVAWDATGVETYTIHRALGYITSLGQAQVNSVTNASCLIIDEFSMVDLPLAHELFRCVSASTKVILVGDSHQLPSIGPGALLRDLLLCGTVDHITLTVVKRQAEKSGILLNANRIDSGIMIRTEQRSQKNEIGNAYVIEKRGAIEIQHAVLYLLKIALQVKKYRIEDVQILCPQRKGDVGVDVLNYLIQQELYPDYSEEQVIPCKSIILNASGKPKKIILAFKCGDKVIHKKNKYNVQWYQNNSLLGLIPDHERLGIVNGEMGSITQINVRKDGKSNKSELIVRFPEGYVKYEDDFSQLEHAYAMTVHKSQGSQWPVIISPISTSNQYMLSRNLFYTLYTRARDLIFTVGEQSALRYAISNVKDANRQTNLCFRLQTGTHNSDCKDHQ